MAQIGEHEGIGEYSVEEAFQKVLLDHIQGNEGKRDVPDRERLNGERSGQLIKANEEMLMQYAMHFHQKLQRESEKSQRDMKALKAQNKYLEEQLQSARKQKKEVENKVKNLQKKVKELEFEQGKSKLDLVLA